MKSSPVLEIPHDLLDRWRSLQRFRAARSAGRCDCQCGRCSTGAARAAGPRPGS